MDRRELALAQLRALLEIRGSLQTITDEVRPEYRVDAKSPRSPLRPELDVHRSNPAAYVCQPITRLEGPDARGAWRAWAEDGSWRAGYPEDLLIALLAWQVPAPPIEV